MAEWKKQELRRSAGSKGGSKKVANRVANRVAASEIEIEDEKETVLRNTMTVGILPDFVEMCLLQWASQGGKNANGIEVNATDYVTKRWKIEGTEWRAKTHRSYPGRPGTAKRGCGALDANGVQR